MRHLKLGKMGTFEIILLLLTVLCFFLAFTQADFTQVDAKTKSHGAEFTVYTPTTDGDPVQKVRILHDNKYFHEYIVCGDYIIERDEK